MKDGMSDGLLKKKKKQKEPFGRRRLGVGVSGLTGFHFIILEKILLNLKFVYDLRILNLGLIEYRPPTATHAATTNHIA